jgi:hypothetical protein
MLEEAIEFHAAMHVTNSIPLGCQLPLTVATINCVETRQAADLKDTTATITFKVTDRDSSPANITVAVAVEKAPFSILINNLNSRGVRLRFAPLLRLMRCHACDK